MSWGEGFTMEGRLIPLPPLPSLGHCGLPLPGPGAHTEGLLCGAGSHIGLWQRRGGA